MPDSDDTAMPPPSRPALPTRADDLPPMDRRFDEMLDTGLAELGLTGTLAGDDAARASYEAHARLLRAWSEAINLTTIREPADIARRHVCDSLSAAAPLVERLWPGASLIDVGSGAGYPGLPLVAALPLGRAALLDSVGKKARFLGVAAAAVGAALAAAGRPAPIVEAIAERAEDLAGDEEHRATWDVVTARAVGSLAEVVELALPLLREGGLAVVWKREEERGGLRSELRDAGSIIRSTGGGRPEVIVVDAASLPGHRLVVVRKERPTPGRFPRPASIRRRGRR